MNTPITTAADPPAFEVIPPLRQDLAIFGFETFKQYRHWCSSLGLIDGLKGVIKRQKFADQRNRNLRPAPPLTLERRTFLEQIATGRYPGSSWHTKEIERAVGDDTGMRSAFLRLILHVDRYMHVMRSKRFYRMS